MELNSFKFGLHLFLLIYSRTIVIDRYSVFTALEKDVYELEVMSKFYFWNGKYFCINTAVYNSHGIFHRVYK